MCHRRRFPVFGLISALVVVTAGCDLPSLDARAFTDGAARSRFEDAYERLEAVCRIILGR